MNFIRFLPLGHTVPHNKHNLMGRDFLQRRMLNLIGLLYRFLQEEKQAISIQCLCKKMKRRQIFHQMIVFFNIVVNIVQAPQQNMSSVQTEHSIVS